MFVGRVGLLLSLRIVGSCSLLNRSWMFNVSVTMRLFTRDSFDSGLVHHMLDAGAGLHGTSLPCRSHRCDSTGSFVVVLSSLERPLCDLFIEGVIDYCMFALVSLSVVSLLRLGFQKRHRLTGRTDLEVASRVYAWIHRLQVSVCTFCWLHSLPTLAFDKEDLQSSYTTYEPSTSNSMTKSDHIICSKPATSPPSVVNAKLMDDSSHVKHLDRHGNTPITQQSSLHKLRFSAACGWTQPTLTKLASYHPLEHYHQLFPLPKRHAVLTELPCIFRLDSLVVEYQDSPIRARCCTVELVRFNISLWEHNELDCFVLEIQRIAGDAVVFGRYARDILQRLETHDESPMDLSGTGAIPPKVMRLLNARQREDVCSDKETALSALEIAENLLTTSRYDARRLGLEVLLSMLEPSCTSPVISQTTACHVLSKSTVSRDMVLSLALHQSWPSDCALDESLPTSDLTYMGLVIVTRGLQIVGDELPLGEFEYMVPPMMTRADNGNPHVRWQVLQALEALQSDVPVEWVERVTRDMHHAALEQTSHALLQRLLTPTSKSK